MIKDIQEEVFEKLNEIEDVEVYSYLPPDFVDLDKSIIIFTEVSNLPSYFGDNKELISEIIYNIDIYMKTPETYLLRREVDKKMTEIGFVREASSSEWREEEYYYRLLTYKTKI